MTVTTTRAGDTLILRVAGRLDGTTSAEFVEMWRQCMTSEIRRTVMDFESLEYLSSAGLRAILLAGKAMRASSGVLGLSGLRGRVKDILEMAGFCAMFPVYDSVQAALEQH